MNAESQRDWKSIRVAPQASCVDLDNVVAILQRERRRLDPIVVAHRRLRVSERVCNCVLFQSADFSCADLVELDPGLNADCRLLAGDSQMTMRLHLSFDKSESGIFLVNLQRAVGHTS